MIHMIIVGNCEMLKQCQNVEQFILTTNAVALKLISKYQDQKNQFIGHVILSLRYSC